MGDPATGSLVDVPGGSDAVAAGGAGAGANVTSPRRAAFAAADAGDRGASASGAIGGAPATNPSMAAGATGAAAGTATRRTLAEAESPLDDTKSSAAGDGDLPQSLKGDTKRFLSTEEQDRAMALALQEQLNMEDSGGNAAAMAYQAGQPMAVAPAAMIGRLTVTVVEAKLAKNYGLTRMDPYCRVRVGHSVYETPTCPNGAKEPKWNKTFACYLYQGIKNMDVEIYDECTFATDPQIASGNFPIPTNVVKNQEVADLWLPLSGAEGEGKEGMIHIILSLTPIAPGAPLPQQPRTVPNVAAGGRPMTYTAQPQPGGQGQPQQQPQQPQRPPRLTEEELEEFVKMFPNLDRDIIASVYAASGGDKETMVNNLLQLSQQ